MELLYKKHILNELDHIYTRGSFFEEFWNRELLAYCKDIGYNVDDPKDAYYFLVSLKDEEYCGCLNEIKRMKNGDYYLYDPEDKMLYWFKNSGDAIYFANQFNGATLDLSLISKPQQNFSYSSDFQLHNRKLHNGFYWLLADDLDSLDDIISAPLAIYCIEREKYFITIEEAAQWLVTLGKAANLKTAIRQLTKCLNGETSKCYNLSWRRQ